MQRCVPKGTCFGLVENILRLKKFREKSAKKYISLFRSASSMIQSPRRVVHGSGWLAVTIITCMPDKGNAAY